MKSAVSTMEDVILEGAAECATVGSAAAELRLAVLLVLVVAAFATVAVVLMADVVVAILTEVVLLVASLVEELEIAAP